MRPEGFGHISFSILLKRCQTTLLSQVTAKGHLRCQWGYTGGDPKKHKVHVNEMFVHVLKTWDYKQDRMCWQEDQKSLQLRVRLAGQKKSAGL